MKKILLFVVMLFAGLLVSAQTENDTVSIHGNNPQIKINVKKIYDKKGNVIGYDSTYRWSYSNEGKTLNINADSLFSKFRPFFDEHFLKAPADPFNKRFFNDSTIYNDFFNNDKFFERWQDELFNYKKEIKSMDSLKRIFFKKYINERREKKNKGKI